MMQAYWLLVRWNWPFAIFLMGLVLTVELTPGIPANDRVLLFFGIVLVIALPSNVILLLGARKRAKECAPSANEQLTFSELYATGHSNQNFLYSLVMVRRGLIVQ